MKQERYFSDQKDTPLGFVGGKVKWGTYKVWHCWVRGPSLLIKHATFYLICALGEQKENLNNKYNDYGVMTDGMTRQLQHWTLYQTNITYSFKK